MDTLSHPESRQMYSWWWDSHISPKNSKWLQENLTDMDRNIKAMIKLIEEEADSFAMRAEMYYRKRPELMKLVEEFYRAYRALAERYDHATGALCQAQQTMAEAFSNQIPSVFANETSSTYSDIHFRPCTPEMSSCIQALVYPDELHKDELGVSSQFHAVSLNGSYPEQNYIPYRKKGLKHFNELFPTEERTGVSSEGKVRKVLSFLEDEGKIGEREDFKHESEQLQQEIAHLSNKNATLRRQMTSESVRIQNLEDTFSKLKSEKESALLRYDLYMNRICCLETQISNATNEFYNIKDEIAVKINYVERQCLLLGKENNSLHVDLEAQQKKLRQRVGELEKIKTSIQEEHHKRMHAEAALMSLEKIHSHTQEEAEFLAVEFQRVVDKLKDMEVSKAYLEKELSKLTDIITGLKEQNNSFNFKMIELQDERTLLIESKWLLENELWLHSVEKGALQEEIYILLKDKNNLQQKNHVLTKQTEVVLYKNEVLDNSLSDANIELDGLREKVKALEASCDSLLGEIIIHTAEKAVLVCQIRTVFQYIENLSGKCVILEKSLSDAHAEIEESRIKVKYFEESWNSINHQNSSLLAENNTLASQVDIIQENDENSEIMHMELQNKYFILEKEKNSMLHKLTELATSIEVERKEHEAAILSSKRQLDSSENKIHNLLDESKVKEGDFIIEQDKAISTSLEIFILQRCLYDMNDKNLIVSRQCQKLVEASLFSEKVINQLEHKDLVQKKKMMSMLEYNVKLKEGCFLLLNGLNNRCQITDVADDEAIFRTILDETKNLKTSISSAQVENHRLHLEIVVLDTLLKQIGLENFHLKSELEGRNAETITFKRKKDEFIEMNEQLQAEIRTLSEQFSDLHDAHQISQIEISNLIEKNWSLSKRFDKMRVEKDALEVENSELLAQVMILDHLSIYFRSLCFDRMLELDSLNDSMFCLPVVKDYLEEGIRVQNERMGLLEDETIHLEDPIVQKFHLNLTSSFVKEFDLCIKTGKSLLSQKEADYSGALDKITGQQDRQSSYKKYVGVKHAELFSKLAGSCMNLDGAKVVREELEIKPEDREEENRMLRTNLNASLPLVSSLSLGIASLEEHIFSLSRQARKIGKTTRVSNVDDYDPSIFQLQQLEKLVAKVEALRDVIIDMEKLLLLERLHSNATLESRRKEIEELRVRVSTGKQNSKERFGQTIKDIQLDRVSSSPAGSYGLNKIDNSKLDDELLQLWETAESDDKEEEVVVGNKSQLLSSEVVEIEQSIDKLEVSIKVNESPVAWKRRVMEILVSDSHRLLILQKGLQELKTKWMISENKKNLKCVEHNNFKLNLTEAEAATLEEVDLNGRLKNRVRDTLGSSNFPIGVIEQRQLLESAIRGSEKIGKLELDLQKIEYIFLKLQEENRRSRFGNKKVIVLLRGYINGKKDGKVKRRFCGCTKPKTDG